MGTNFFAWIALDREDAGRYIWGNELGEDNLIEATTNPLYLYQACEALYCIFKELLMEFFNEGHERNYPQKRLGLLTAYYRVGIRSVIDKKMAGKATYPI
jgi:hypothetical protein